MFPGSGYGTYLGELCILEPLYLQYLKVDIVEVDKIIIALRSDNVIQPPFFICQV